MNISHIVHEGQKNPSSRKDIKPTQAPADPHARLLHEYRQDMASALTAGPHVNQSPVYTRSPQPPPSPPADDPDTLRTLPSIQSLITMDRSPAGQEQKGAESNPQPATSGEDHSAGHRSQTYGQPTVSNPNNRPLSPPIDPQLGFDAHIQSPSTASSHSSQFAPGSTPSGVEAAQARQLTSNSSLPSMGPPPSNSQSPFQNSQYSEASSANSAYSYPEPAGSGSQPMYAQRPLPTSFPPANVPSAQNPPPSNSSEASPTDPSTPNQWQHHHYMAPSTSASFPGQTQDRYVCQVCNKAFSRPSSLRIHSHSHTGEKPFQCPHKGCGKAFSVRSNMKRHERGCHGGGGDGVTQ